MVVAWPWESQMVVVLLRLEGAQWQSSVSRPCDEARLWWCMDKAGDVRLEGAQWQSSVSRPCDEGKAMVVHGQGSMSNRQAMSQCNSQ